MNKKFAISIAILAVALLSLSVWGEKKTQCLPQEQVCTQDFVELCSPDGQQRVTAPSNCSCGEDAKTLTRKGWRNCPGTSPDTIQPEDPNSGLETIPNISVKSFPTDTVSVKYLIEHRSALNGEMVTVKGVIVASWLDPARCSPNAEYLCPQPVIFLADTSDTNRDPYYNLQVRFVEGQEDDLHNQYRINQTAEIRGKVSGTRDSVGLFVE